MSSSSDHHSISDGEATQGGDATEPAVTTCPNCGDDRAGAFCARCGQSDKDYMRTVWPVVGDFFRETFEIDSRIFRTLKLLFFKPGQLSIEFSQNRRAQYLSPVRLFLFVLFVHLGVTTLVISSGSISRGFSEAPDDAQYLEPTEDQIEAVRAKLGPEQQGQLDDIMGRGPDDLGWQVVATYIAIGSGGNLEWPPVIYRLLIGFYYSPEAVMERLLRRASAVVVLSLPLYALMLAVVYMDKRRFFVEHLVLVTHLQTFSLAALLIYIIPFRGILSVVFLGVSLGHLWYYAMALRRFFRESWGKTLARFLVFGILSMLVTIGGSIASFYLS